MIKAVADTHALIWYLFDDARLSAAAGALIDAAVESSDEIGVSAITPIETIYLVEKGRIPAEALRRMIADLESPESVFVEIPVDLKVTSALVHIARAQTPDMPDRIVAATALALGVPVISRDPDVRVPGMATIW